LQFFIFRFFFPSCILAAVSIGFKNELDEPYCAKSAVKNFSVFATFVGNILAIKKTKLSPHIL